MEVLLVKLNKSKIIVLSFMALLVATCQSTQSMFHASLVSNKPATQEQIRQAKSCPICLEELKEQDNLSALHCNTNVPHIFHKECLNGWITERKIKCPVCRSPISAKLVRENLQTLEARNTINRYTKTLGILTLDAASIFAGYKLASKWNPSLGLGLKMWSGFIGFIWMQNLLDILKSRDPEANRR